MWGTGEPVGPLSGQDVTQLAAQIADTTNAGLPLHSGLRALGEEITSRRLRSALNRLAGALESGSTLEQALAAEERRLPAHLRGLVLAGSRAGRVGEVLGNFAAFSDAGSDLRRSLWLRLIYPVFSIVFGIAVFIFVSVMMVGGFAKIFRDFGINPPLLTTWFLSVGEAVSRIWWPFLQGAGAILVVGLILNIALPSKYRGGIFAMIPLFGRVWNLTSSAEFCHLLALLLECEIPLDKALPTAGEGVEDVRIARASSLVAEDVAAGQPLAEALYRRSLFPPGFAKILGWAQEHRGLPEALHMAGEMFFTKARTYADFVATVCSVLAVLSILGGVAVTVVALMAPLINLIARLSG